MTPEEQRALDLRKRQLKARMAAAPVYDDMGFPLAPAGGSSVNPETIGLLRSATTGAANGMSFGFGDNIAGVIGGVDSMVRGNGFTKGYDNTLGLVRSGMAEDKAANPMTYGAGNLIGSAVPAIAAAPLATGSTLLRTMGLGGLIGGVEGAAHGAGNADGQGVASAAIKSGLVGAGIGALAPGLIAGLGVLKNNATSLGSVIPGIKGMFATANRGKADRAIAGLAARSGKSEADLTALLSAARTAGQPEFRLVDALGLSGQRMANGIARKGGQPGDDIAAFLADRQAGQGDRVGAFVEDAFNVGGTTAAKTKDGLMAARGDAADAAYGAARGNAAPVDVRGALGVIDDRIGGMKGSGVSGDGIDGKLAGYRSRLAAQPGPDGAMRELSDFDRVLGVKQSVQDDIGAAVRAGRNNEARELGKLSAELDAALEGSSDMYRAANDGFRSASKVISAVDEGAMMVSKARAADNVPRFGAMAAAEQDAARVGYGDRLLKSLGDIKAPTANRAKAISSPKLREQADAMARDPRLYADRLGRESTMWETQNRALGGSQTANNLDDMGDVGGLSEGSIGILRSAANLNFGDTVAKVLAKLGPIAKGQNEATRDLIAKALLSADPAKSLAPALAKAGGAEKINRILEGILRQPGRESIR